MGNIFRISTPQFAKRNGFKVTRDSRGYKKGCYNKAMTNKVDLDTREFLAGSCRES